jgi:hypothetical protein
MFPNDHFPPTPEDRIIGDHIQLPCFDPGITVAPSVTTFLGTDASLFMSSIGPCVDDGVITSDHRTVAHVMKSYKQVGHVL